MNNTVDCSAASITDERERGWRCGEGNMEAPCQNFSVSQSRVSKGHFSNQICANRSFFASPGSSDLWFFVVCSICENLYSPSKR